ncbi:uncharacterized protein KGF55_002909 [Candida pseudojiufengensis]|uniref:uncharacterized protein n=1 Tax=Candida pseudojiufengensis TaxID=497109 RepID=UPI00222557B8|nr:uncharacterized protein KGF55_002909 [Candida pseudojiufengensis]KAI5963117.1 hypothetical protein KGF55_002909 [Candida pseudojiufengensis]
MDPASCGPSSALQNLNKHTQRDTSLQHQRLHLNGPQQQGIHQFRQKHQIDSNLNNDFKHFNQSSNGHDFASSFLQQMNRPQFNQQAEPNMKLQQNQQGWVNDFSNLSIEHQKLNQQHNNWNQQFNQQRSSQQLGPIREQQQQHQPQQHNYHHAHQQYHPNYSMGNFQDRLQMNAIPQYNQQSEHQEMHKLQNQHQQFENEFDILEKELSEQQQEQQASEIAVDDLDSDKEKFAQTAKLVESSMNQINSQDSNMNEKFQNSEFLKLMSSISNKQVELEGDKLVNSENKQDVREVGVPQTTINQQSENVQGETQSTQNVSTQQVNNDIHNIDYHQPIHTHIPSEEMDDWSFDSIPNYPPPQPQQVKKKQQPEELKPQENRLPDPLSHIKDNQLEGILDPLTAARIISGGQVKTRDWTDVEGQDDWLTSDAFPGMNTNPHVPWRKNNVIHNDDNEDFGL